MGIWAWITRRRRELELDEADFKEEVRAHLDIAADERVADGDDPRDARYAALREFGNVTLTTEHARSVWMPRWLETLRDIMRDARYGVRALRRNPVFALTVVGVLALGIGLNAAVFTMLKSMAIAPIAGVDHSSQIAVIIAETDTGRNIRLSYPDYQYLRDHDTAFGSLFGSAVATMNVGRGRSAHQLWGEIVSGNYFPALGVRAQLGRTLLPSDDVAPGQHPVAVISEGLWRRDFEADPAIVGRTVEINNVPLTIVGVLEPQFHGTTVVYDVDVYVPVMTAPSLGFAFGTQQTAAAAILADPQATVFFPQGFLRAGVSRAAAAAQIDALWTTRRRERPLEGAQPRLRVLPFVETPGGAPTFVMPTLGVLSVTGILVLLIACANVAGLVLVRGVSRRGEIALRLALGGSRARIVRLLVVENLVLAIPAAALGVLLAQNTLPVLIGYAEALASPARLFFNSQVDGYVIAFAVLIGCASAVIFGFVPALQSSRVDLVSVINADASPRGARGRLRGALVVAQVAVSVLLLVGAGLITRSQDAARRAYPGFDASQVTDVTLAVRLNGYDEARGRVFYRRLLETARADSGVESATLSAYPLLSLTDSRAQPVTIDGYSPREREDLTFTWNTVAPDYFTTLRIPLLAGRDFDDRDSETSEPVTVVNRTMAERFFGGHAPALGKRLRLADGRWRTVVGVVADAKYARIDESPRPHFYVPFEQAYRGGMSFHVRGSAPIDQLVTRASALVAAVDPELPIVSARPLSERTKGALIFMDLAAAMLMLFGNAGLALAALGTYGLVSYTVKHRTHEIGIRIALGAPMRSILMAFLNNGLRLGTIGAVLGIIGALGLGSLMRSVLFGVSTTDAFSFGRALVIVLAGVAVASLVPAWRAARTNPLTALRHQ